MSPLCQHRALERHGRRTVLPGSCGELKGIWRVLHSSASSALRCPPMLSASRTWLPQGFPALSLGSGALWGAPKSDACTLSQVSALHTLSSVWCHWACRILPPWLKKHPKVHEVLMREASPVPCSNSMHCGTPAPSIQRPLCALPWFTYLVDSSFCVCANADTILSRPPTYSST